MSGPTVRSLDGAALSHLVSAILNESRGLAPGGTVDLGKVWDKLVVELTPGLAAIVPVVECAVLGVQPCRLSDYTASEPAMFVLARQDEGHGLLLFRFSAEAVDWWLSCSLGGAPVSGLPAMRAISNFEVRVGRVAIDLAIGALVRVLSALRIDLKLHECRACSAAQDLPSLPSDRSGYVVAIGLVPNSASLKLSFFISDDLARDWATSLATESETLDSVAQAKSDQDHWTDGFATQMSTITVEIDAVLTTESIELEEMLAWSPGHVVALQATTESHVLLVSHDVALFSGRLGKIEGQLSVQLGHAIGAGLANVENQLSSQ